MESFGSYHILLVESDSATAAMAESLLLKWGLKVSVAGSGKDAIELTKVNAYDFILMDIQLSDMDGYETARIIRRLGDQFENVPIIGHSNLSSDQQHAYIQGMNDFILKPFEPTELYNTLKKHIDKDHPDVMIANLDRCTEGDTEFRKELAQLLANNITELLLNIEKALKLKDPTIFGRAVHKTKTTLSILGDGALTDELSLIQTKIGDETSQVELERHVQKLNNKCKRTINILNSLSTV